MKLIKGALLEDKDYCTLKYDGISISGEVFVSAMLVDTSNNKLFELADYIQKPEWDEGGDYTGLVAGLIGCANMGIKNIVINGSSKLEQHDEIKEFYNELFANFVNVASVFIEEPTEARNLTNEVIGSKTRFYRDFSK
jgi:triosephosphate isomerase